MEESVNAENEVFTAPEEFKKIIDEFTNDLKGTFPDETEEKISLLYKNDELDYESIYKHCQSVYPERFFDILYQNEDMFKSDDYNFNFLPEIDFKILWELEDVSQQTKATIWKYLQLILFSTVGNMEDGKSFGDTAKLFEAVDKDEFKDKIKETMENLQKSFENKNIDLSSNIFENMPNAENFQEHISTMLDGKIGQLAREIAEETAEEFQKEMGDDIQDSEQVLKEMMKNPTKLMSLVKKAGSKLDQKIKSGEIKKSELMEEAGELMKNMKNMPGMDNINSMLGQMGMQGGIPGMGGGIPGMGRKAKFNQGAFKSQMDRHMKMEETKERIRAKARENAIQKEVEAEELKKRQAEYDEFVKNGGLDELIFSLGEKPEKSTRETNQNKPNKAKKVKKKKKGKK